MALINCTCSPPGHLLVSARYREARAEVPDSFGLVANKIWKDRLVVVSPSLATP